MAGYRTVNKPLEWFKANAENYRSHPAEQQAVLQASLRRFGVFRNVVARPDGTLLAGHGILAAAQAEGIKVFPVIIFEGTDEEARALMVADNEQSRLAVDDDDQLSQLLTALQADGLMAVTGHDDESLAQLLEAVAAQAPPTGVLPGDPERMTLAERFGVPPFSVLDARQGYWQDRKRKWLALGIQSELGRGGGHLEGVRDRPANGSPTGIQCEGTDGGSRSGQDRTGQDRTGQDREHSRGRAAERAEHTEAHRKVRGLGARVANAEAADAGYYRKKRALEKRIGREATREEVLAGG